MPLRPHSTGNRNPKGSKSKTDSYSKKNVNHSPQQIEQFLEQSRLNAHRKRLDKKVKHQKVVMYKNVRSIPLIYAYKPSQLKNALVESPVKYKQFFQKHKACSYGEGYVQPLLRHFKEWKKHIRSKLKEVFDLVIQERDIFGDNLEERVGQILIEIKTINKGLRLGLKEMMESVRGAEVSNLFESFLYTEEYIIRVIALIEYIYSYCHQVNQLLESEAEDPAKIQEDIIGLKKKYQKKVSEALIYCASHPESTLLNRMELQIKYKFDQLAKESIRLSEYIRRLQQAKLTLNKTLIKLKESDKSLTVKMLENIHQTLLEIDQIKNPDQEKFSPNNLKSEMSEKYLQSRLIYVSTQGEKRLIQHSMLSRVNQKRKSVQNFAATDSIKSSSGGINNILMNRKITQLLYQIGQSEQQFLNQLQFSAIETVKQEKERIGTLHTLFLLKNKGEEFKNCKKKFLYLAKIYRSRQFKTDPQFAENCSYLAKKLSPIIQNILQIYDSLIEKVHSNQNFKFLTKLPTLQFVKCQLELYQKQQANIIFELSEFVFKLQNIPLQNPITEKSYQDLSVIQIYSKISQKHQDVKSLAKDSQLINQLIQILRYSEKVAPQLQIFKQIPLSNIINEKIPKSKQRDELQKYFQAIKSRNKFFLSEQLPQIMQNKVYRLRQIMRMELIDLLLNGDRAQTEFIQGFENIKNANDIQVKSLLQITSLFSTNKTQLIDQNDSVFKRIILKYRRQSESVSIINKGHLLQRYINELMESHLLSMCNIQAAEETIHSLINRFSRKHTKDPNAYKNNREAREKLEKTFNRLVLIQEELVPDELGMRQSVAPSLLKSQNMNRNPVPQKDSIFISYLRKQIQKIRRFIERQRVFVQMELSQFTNCIYPSIGFIYSWAKRLYEHYIVNRQLETQKQNNQKQSVEKNKNKSILKIQPSVNWAEKQLSDFHQKCRQNLKLHMQKLNQLVERERQENANPNQCFLNQISRALEAVQKLSECSHTNFQQTMSSLMQYLRKMEIWHIGLYASNSEPIMLMPWDEHGLLRQIEKLFQLDPFSIQSVQSFQVFDVQNFVKNLLSGLKQQRNETQKEQLNYRQFILTPQKGKVKPYFKQEMTQGYGKQIDQEVLDEVIEEEPQFLLGLESNKKKPKQEVVEELLQFQQEKPDQIAQFILDDPDKKPKSLNPLGFLIGGPQSRQKKKEQAPQQIREQGLQPKLGQNQKRYKNYLYFRMPMIDTPESVSDFIEFNKKEQIIIQEAIQLEVLLKCLEPIFLKKQILSHLDRIIALSNKKSIIGIMNIVNKFTPLQKKMIQLRGTIEEISRQKQSENSAEYQLKHETMKDRLFEFLVEIGMEYKVLYRRGPFDLIVIVRVKEINAGYFCKSILNDPDPMKGRIENFDVLGIHELQKQLYSKLHVLNRKEMSEFERDRIILVANQQIDLINAKLHDITSPVLTALNDYKDYLLYNQQETHKIVTFYIKDRIGQTQSTSSCFAYLNKDLPDSEIIMALCKSLQQIKILQSQTKTILFSNKPIFCSDRQTTLEQFFNNNLFLKDYPELTQNIVNKLKTEKVYSLNLDKEVNEINKEIIHSAKIDSNYLISAFYDQKLDQINETIKQKERISAQMTPILGLYQFFNVELPFKKCHVSSDLEMLKFLSMQIAAQYQSFILNEQSNVANSNSQDLIKQAFILQSKPRYQNHRIVSSHSLKRFSQLLTQHQMPHCLVKHSNGTPIHILSKYDPVMLRSMLGINITSSEFERIYNANIMRNTNKVDGCRQEVQISNFFIFLEINLKLGKQRQSVTIHEFLTLLSQYQMIVVSERQIGSNMPVSPTSFILQTEKNKLEEKRNYNLGEVLQTQKRLEASQPVTLHAEETILIKVRIDYPKEFLSIRLIKNKEQIVLNSNLQTYDYYDKFTHASASKYLDQALQSEFQDIINRKLESKKANQKEERKAYEARLISENQKKAISPSKTKKQSQMIKLVERILKQKEENADKELELSYLLTQGCEPRQVQTFSLEDFIRKPRRSIQADQVRSEDNPSGTFSQQEDYNYQRLMILLNNERFKFQDVQEIINGRNGCK